MIFYTFIMFALAGSAVIVKLMNLFYEFIIRNNREWAESEWNDRND